MEWVKEFYNQQYKWMESNDNQMLTMQEKLLQKIHKHANKPVNTILELGGGKGYFAIAAALEGYQVTVIELIEEATQSKKKLAELYSVQDKIKIITGNFYTVELDQQYDVVCYWDGFGIGTDSEQQKLLWRIESWLASDGVALIDIYTPWFWKKVAGQEMQVTEKLKRKYDFDVETCRMLDSWWDENEASAVMTQSLRCYSPVDLQLLLQNHKLTLINCDPGGSMDYVNWKYTEKAPMQQAQTYLAKLILAD